MQFKIHPSTFISSRFAGKTPGLRLDNELFCRAKGIGGSGGAVGKETTMEAGIPPTLLLWPSATGLQQMEKITVFDIRANITI